MTTTTNAQPTVTAKLEAVSTDQLTLSLPGTDYRIELATTEPIKAEVGQRITGIVSVQAQRVDVIQAGGRYIEPVYGKPRRLQGKIIGGDVQQNLLYVNCTMPVVCKLMDIQNASDFMIGQTVSFDVEPGTAFQPEQP